MTIDQALVFLVWQTKPQSTFKKKKSIIYPLKDHQNITLKSQIQEVFLAKFIDPELT